MDAASEAFAGSDHVTFSGLRNDFIVRVGGHGSRNVRARSRPPPVAVRWLVSSVLLLGCEAEPSAPPAPSNTSDGLGAGVCGEEIAPSNGDPMAIRVLDFCPTPRDPLQPPAANAAGPCAPRIFGDCNALIQLGLSESWAERYVHDSGGPATVDLSLMRFVSPEGAFAAFTDRVLVMVDPEAPDVSAVDGVVNSVSRGASVHAVNGAHLFELHYTDPWQPNDVERTVGRDVLGEFARTLKARLPGGAELPRTVELLPTADRLPWGVRVSYRHAFGLEGAGPAAVGYYARGHQRYRIFVAQYRDEASARDVLRSIRRSGQGHRLEDFPFDCFELSGSAGFGDAASLWLVGKNGARVVAVGSEPPKPPGHQAKHQPSWLSRPEKLQLLRAVFNRR